jgi:predicted nucleic acid-binding protein
MNGAVSHSEGLATMIGAPPKTFLDTQIVSDVERGYIGADDWSHVSHYLKQATRYCISALTIGELLAGMAKGDSEYFEKHKRRLRVLLSPGPPAEVFDFIIYFVARELGLPVQRPAHLEDDFLNAIDLILSAPSKEALLDGFPLPGADSDQTVRIRIDRFVKEMEENRGGYTRVMGYRQGRIAIEVSPQLWASKLLEFYGVSGSADSITDVAERLSATYEFEMAVNKLVQNPNFPVPRRTSDLVDGQQLCYLCNPNVVFITNDSDFRTRAVKSPQAKRIKTFAEVLACAEGKSPLL